MIVTGTLHDVDGSPAGRVLFRRTEQGIVDGVFHGPGEKEATTDADGEFEIELTPGWWEMLWLQAKRNIVVEGDEETKVWTELLSSVSAGGLSTGAGGTNTTSVLNRAALKAMPDNTPFETVIIREPEEAGIATVYYKHEDDETEANDFSIIASNGGGLRWFARQ